MPLINLFKEELFSLAIWQVEESVEELVSLLQRKNFNLCKLNDFSNENRKLEWLGCRAALYHLVDETTIHINYDENNKPLLSNYKISFSHSKKYSAAIISKYTNPAIDLECYSSKVLRVKHKYLNSKEISLLKDTENVKELILFWSAKESLFKFYSSGNLDFKKNIELLEFNPKSEKKSLFAKIHKSNFEQKIEVFYNFFDDFVLTYIANPNI